MHILPFLLTFNEDKKNIMKQEAMQVDNTGKTMRKVPLHFLPLGWYHLMVLPWLGLTYSDKALKVGLGGTNGRRKRDVGLLPLRSKLALVCKITCREQWATLWRRGSQSCNHQELSPATRQCAEEDIQTQVTLQSQPALRLQSCENLSS